MATPSRDEISPSNTWDLAPLFSDLGSWKKEFERLEAAAPEISTFEGKLAESAEVLQKAIECYLDISQSLEKVYCYCHLLSDVDTANNTNLGYLGQATNLYTRISALSSFLTPELLSIEESTLNNYLESPLLAPYARMIREIVRYKKHTLTKKEELLLARATEVFMSSEKIFSQLNNADLKFGNLTVEGEEKPLTHSTYSVFLKNSDRDVRRSAYEAYYDAFESHKNTISTSLTGSIKKDIYLANVKNYPNALERSLFNDDVKRSVYENLIETVSNNLEPLHRYYEIRKEKLGLQELYIYDTYLPLVSEIKTNYSYEEASEMVIDSLAPLGSDYTSTLKAGLFEERWVDRFENKGKRSGAYHSGCYGSLPYMLLNYNHENLNDIFTLTHEAGHAMHSHYSSSNQTYQDHSYTIFVAEVASTFNEQLLNKHLRDVHANNPQMSSYLINHHIDDIKATFYRQTMFAEFELLTHEHAERNESLTLDVYRDIYRNLLEKYFGPAITIREIDELECLRIPHFYSAFYVYKYATGISAAISLAKKVLDSEEGSLERYLNFLKSGRTKYPIEQLRDAGVDMETPEPIETAIGVFSNLIDQLEGDQ